LKSITKNITYRQPMSAYIPRLLPMNLRMKFSPLSLTNPCQLSIILLQTSTFDCHIRSLEPTRYNSFNLKANK